MKTSDTTVPCVIMRAGTSKGLFFHAEDLPEAGPRRDRLLKRIMGTPDRLQIDGLGGSRPITSKIAIISRSGRADADVDYLFAQASVESDDISYSGNCGNISAGVGPFAIDEGLVAVNGDVTAVRIHNVNTGKVIVARVPTASGQADVTGKVRVPGVPGTGAGILLDYSHTAGAKTGAVLPTGNPVDEITLEDGHVLRATLCDVANPCVWVSSEELGVDGAILSDDINADDALLERIEEIRARAAVMMGFCKHWREAEARSPGLPMLGFLSPPRTYRDDNGEEVRGSDIDLMARLIFMGRCHESFAGTASICLAASSRLPGTLTHQFCRRSGDQLVIGHPLGAMRVDVEANRNNDGFVRLGVIRTARRLMKGEAFVPGGIASDND